MVLSTPPPKVFIVADALQNLLRSGRVLFKVERPCAHPPCPLVAQREGGDRR